MVLFTHVALAMRSKATPTSPSPQMSPIGYMNRPLQLFSGVAYSKK
jgi:hypothetical protein